MAIVMKAFVLVDTSQPLAAQRAMRQLFGSALTDSSSPIMDVQFGIETAVDIPEHYTTGSFTSEIPEARLLITANTLDKPC